VNGCGGGKWCGGGGVERVGKEREEGLAVASGGLDVPLFRRYGNVARCDITEDVGWVYRTLSHALRFRMMNDPVVLTAMSCNSCLCNGTCTTVIRNANTIILSYELKETETTITRV